MNQNYIATVRLLLAIAPSVFASGRFAMKGGTALNLFVQEMPRLSVDIDLVFVDCFVIYLAGHNRPVHEVLFPKIKPLEPAFTNEFTGMTREKVELDTLVQVQARLLQELPQQLTAAQRDFLLSLVRGEPVWGLMPLPHLHELPALKWKLMNLAKLKKISASRFAAQQQELASRLEQIIS